MEIENLELVAIAPNEGFPSPPYATFEGDRLCNKCLKRLTIDSFGINRTNKDGLDKTCKKCENEMVRARLRRLGYKERTNHSIIDNKKLCGRCKNMKTLDNFWKDKTSKSGYAHICKTCKYPNRTKKNNLIINGKYKKCNNCEIIKELGEFSFKNGHPHSKCKPCTAKIARDKLDEKRGTPVIRHIIIDNKTICNKCERNLDISLFVKCKTTRYGILYICRECQNEKTRKLRRKKPEIYVASQREGYVPWHKTNPQRHKYCQKKRHEERMKNDPNYVLLRKLRKRYNSAIKSNKNYKKSYKTRKILGCDLVFLRSYLLNKFKNKYDKIITWEQAMDSEIYHIDHILPCEIFDFSFDRAQRLCFHFSNLQILTVDDNETKSDFLPDGTRARDSKEKIK